MKKILVSVGVLAIIVGVIYASRVWSNFQVQARTAKFNEEVDNLFGALQKYKERTGSYPSGKDNAGIARALNGENSKNVIVLVGKKSDLNEKGEFLDPWKTPL